MRIERRPPGGKPPSPASDKSQSPSFREALSESRKQPAQGSGTTPGAAGNKEGPGAEAIASSREVEEQRKHTATEPSSSFGAAPSPAWRQTPGPTTGAVEETHAGAATGSIQRLADEIAVLTHADGAQEVQIEIDSKVMQDLRISLIQKDGEVSIRLMTDSTQTRQVLDQGLPQLIAALQARQVVLAGLDVTPRHVPAAAAFPRGKREQSGRDRGGGRGRR
jgi:flagellar hook-length control protein FliK